jgi:hypothetical protein
MDTQITPSTGTDRANTDLAAVVDQALAIALEQGRGTAARFLTDHGAGFALTCRVLAEPAQRRARSGDSEHGHRGLAAPALDKTLL